MKAFSILDIGMVQVWTHRFIHYTEAIDLRGFTTQGVLQLDGRYNSIAFSSRGVPKGIQFQGDFSSKRLSSKDT